MALIRKANTPYSYKGLEIQDAYLVIDDFAKYDKKEKTVVYYVDIYASHDKREQGRQNILKRSTEVCNGGDFDTYFGVQAIASNGDQYHKAYEHIMTLTKGGGVNMEGQETQEELKYKDWQSDEN